MKAQMMKNNIIVPVGSKGGLVVKQPPKDGGRADSDDPYIVAAADKGTATSSNIANGISNDYEFWLEDAFASDGSAGYDHKKMGIRARGAWESVKWMFLELGKDIQAEPFTTAGCGAMLATRTLIPRLHTLTANAC
tara:strand:- start:84 stop:491 length:408 start_codon:yes stop_codon:yes gene_type:complete